MRISDWSSDVCSSDLGPSVLMQGVVVVVLTIAVKVLSLTFIPIPDSKTPTSVGATPPTPISMSLLTIVVRSEEHTSALQSLMRISYAVFCLKKKKTQNTLNQHTDRRTNSKTSY